MRIISGTYRGKNLFTPKINTVRPTSDRAREAIFSIINSKFGSLEDACVLDVFSGTGAFALEALSRGAKEVCMIDKDTTLSAKNAALFVRETAKIKLLRTDALNLPTAPKAYDIIFIDAPYSQGLTEKALIQLEQKGWLKPTTLIITELSKSDPLAIPETFIELDTRTYGIAKFIFLKQI